jgi:hypothetical protein
MRGDGIITDAVDALRPAASLRLPSCAHRSDADADAVAAAGAAVGGAGGC